MKGRPRKGNLYAHVEERMNKEQMLAKPQTLLFKSDIKCCSLESFFSFLVSSLSPFFLVILIQFFFVFCELVLITCSCREIISPIKLFSIQLFLIINLKSHNSPKKSTCSFMVRHPFHGFDVRIRFLVIIMLFSPVCLRNPLIPYLIYV